MENMSRGKRTGMRTVTVGLEKIREVDELSLSPGSNGNDNAIAQAHGPRRSSLPTPGPIPKKDCWNTCDYPSECRWGRQFGVHTSPPPPPLSQPSLQPSTSAVIADPKPPLSVPTEGILNLENVAPNTHVYTVPGKRKHGNGNEKPENLEFWSALIASARRRKSVPPSSPLAAGGEGLEREVQTPPPPPRAAVAIPVPVPGHGHGLEYPEAKKNIDSDVVMGGNIDPTLLEISPTAMLAATSTISVTPVTAEIKEKGRSSSSNSNFASASSWRSAKPAIAAIPEPIFGSNSGFGVGEKGNVNGRGTGTGESMEMDMEGFAQLERVKSRDSRYASQM
ncbi:hypothetical protein BCR34DRAFT_558039 [Clohesyomyces aquaticus]|uniref:Uncharacterized protein n=1 Tax=Clohesyomyces aquaticus TaxID=1231657 RepID=A0A1Y2A0U8_9PLEO|nr:hypothetical protein BCR34DRAFT_558039 [Clohesyomyces aquaticus]